jgi:hypothetical protein
MVDAARVTSNEKPTSQVDSFRADDKSRVTMPGSHSLYIRIRRTQ